GHDVVEQIGVESTVQVSHAPLTHIRAVEARMDKADIEKQAQELLERLDNLSKMKGWTINFSLIPEFDQPVIKLIDAETKQVIRQIPSEEMLLINKRFQSMEQSGNTVSNLAGLLFDGQV
ncbi:TPA: flagellar protein FlaG, partial [Aeromonas veronii]